MAGDFLSKGLGQALFEAGAGFVTSVEKPGVVSGNGGGDEVAKGRDCDRVFGSGCGMIDFFQDFVTVGIGGGLKVGLEFVREFPEVVPEAGEVGPLAEGFPFGSFGEHVGGEAGGEVGNFVEVAVLGVEVFAAGAGGGVIAGAGNLWLGGEIMTGTVMPRGEEGFPGCLVRVGGFPVREGGGVGVVAHGAGFEQGSGKGSVEN